MGALIHPFSKARYERNDDGTIKVTATDGRVGVFQRNGKWVSGELREADAQVCGWVGGPRLLNHRLTDTAAAAKSN